MATTSNFIFVLSVFFTWLLQMSRPTLGSASPGLQIHVSQSGLNYAAGVFADILAKSAGQLKIPDQHGSASVIVGKVTYDVTNIHVTNFNKPGVNVLINPGKGATFQLSNAGISVNGNWHYEYRLAFIKIQASGTFDGDVSGASLSESVSLGMDTTGRPTIASTGCQCNINSVTIRVYGGASWLYNLFIGYVEQPVRSSLQTQICVEAQNAINNNARSELATQLVNFTIGNNWMVDYGLTSLPDFKTGFVDSYHKGEFSYKGERAEAPFQPAAFPVFTSNRMVTILMSDYILKTIGYVLYKHDVFKYNLTKNDLLADERGFFNTTCTEIACFGYLIPAAAKAFPRAFVEMEMIASSYPNATISSTGIQVNIAGIIVYRARLSNGSLVPMFRTKVSLVVNLKLSLTNMILTGDFNNISPSFQLAETQIGPIPDAVLNDVFNFAARLFLIPRLKEAGQKGFPIPAIKYVSFTNTILENDSHCLRISTDVKQSA